MLSTTTATAHNRPTAAPIHHLVKKVRFQVCDDSRPAADYVVVMEDTTEITLAGEIDLAAGE